MAFSYSAIKLYEQCPSKYKFSRIDRIPEPSGDAASRGTLIHAELEHLINGELQTMTDDVKHMLPKITAWVECKARPEMQFAVDDQWSEVEYSSPGAMLRGVIDLYLEDGDTATVIDFKTGKDRDYSDQVTVYAAVILGSKPHINQVKIAIEFVDLKKTTSYATITRDQLDELKASIVRRMDIIGTDHIFAPNPSFLCRFCHYRKENGGPCKW